MRPTMHEDASQFAVGDDGGGGCEKAQDGRTHDER
jgi:hypothetical protein